MGAGDVYDYVVVGAGSAGCIVARRLAETGADVLLLEAGPTDSSRFVRKPGMIAISHKEPAPQSAGPEVCCFGPVVALHPYRTVSEAIALANDTDYGLNASVFGSDLKRAQEVAVKLQAGNVNVNEGFATAYASKGTPSGGVKQSGVGARHGDYRLLKYTDVQNLAVMKKQVMGPQGGQSFEDYARNTLKSLDLMRRTRVR